MAVLPLRDPSVEAILAAYLVGVPIWPILYWLVRTSGYVDRVAQLD